VPYEIRPARQEEFVLLADVERNAAQRFAEIPGLADLADDDPNSLDIIASAAHCGAVFVAVHEASIVGFLIAGFLDRTVYIFELAVHRSHGRRGLGRGLVEEACRLARQEHLTGVTLSTFIDVPWNGPFYRRIGFRYMRRDEWTPGLYLVHERETVKGLPMDRRSFMRKEIE
jgi:GNAT superfamily N-acetyltransferase